MGDETIKKRFAAKAKLDPNTGCLEWTAGRSRGGYGAFHIGKRQRPAHRVAFEMHKGEIPPGMFVCHRCDNPICVNPDHLFLGTHADNMKDRNEKGRQARGRGEKNSTAKLTQADVIAIRDAVGIPVVELARQYGVSHSHISKIRLRSTWSHLR